MNKLLLILFLAVLSTNNSIAQFYEQNFTYKLPDGTVNVDAIYSNSVNLSYTYKNNGCDMVDVKLQYWTGFSWSNFTIDPIQQSLVVYGISEKYGFTAGTHYDGRLRLQNCVGITDVLFEFTTMATTTPPTVVTNNASSITTSSATLNGNVTDDGGETVTSRGFYFGSSVSSLSKYTSGSGTGIFSYNTSSLLPNTNYYFQAFAENIKGESKGLLVNFKTNVNTAVPTVTTTTATNITTSGAISGGNVTYDGNSTVTERGVYYSTSPIPTTGTPGGTGTGQFSVNLSYLTPNTTYYYRAYAKNITGTGYGNELTFTTLNITGLPTVTTTSATSITTNSAILNGNVTADGGSAVLERGICYSLNPNPTTGTPGGTGTGVFSVNAQYLISGQTYYFRAYARNANGIVYGNQLTFTVENPSSVPEVTTYAASDITPTTAIGGGQITYNGNSGILESGICYSTSNTPTISNSKTVSNVYDYFNVMMSPLLPNTTYYFRAYAINGIGVGYGNILSFTTGTSMALPTVVVNSMASIEATTATGSGNVTSDGGSAVTSRGLVWNTTGNPSLLSYTGVSSNGTGTGTFTSNLQNLNCGTTYYVKAYATNSVGTAYSPTQTIFTTTYSTMTPVDLIYGLSSKISGAPAVMPDPLIMFVYNDASYGCSNYLSYNTPLIQHFAVEGTLAIGKQLYYAGTCTKSTATTFWIYDNSGTTYIVGAVNGIITLYDVCLQEVNACASDIEYTGGQTYPTEKTVDLGSNMGVVSFTFNSYAVPDRFIVEYKGSVVIDTQYRGNSSSYDFGGSGRTAFKNSLTGKYEPYGTYTYPNTTVYPDDGYPRINNTRSETVDFNKHSTQRYATIKVYAPIPGTQWKINMSCPH